MERTKPSFKLGQIVVMKSIKREFPFRILSLRWEDGWYYQWNKNNYASERMIRELSPREKGED